MFLAYCFHLSRWKQYDHIRFGVLFITFSKSQFFSSLFYILRAWGWVIIFQENKNVSKQTFFKWSAVILHRHDKLKSGNSRGFSMSLIEKNSTASINWWIIFQFNECVYDFNLNIWARVRYLPGSIGMFLKTVKKSKKGSNFKKLILYSVYLHFDYWREMRKGRKS